MDIEKGIPKLEHMNDLQLREASLDMTRSEQRHKHQIEDNKWSSCCFTLNKEAVIFFSHYIVLITILFTSVIGVFTDHNNKDTWLNILLLSIGAIFPSPSMKNNNKK